MSISTTAQRNFVLVHGAWRGGWCYSRVADVLRAGGHRVFTPTLTGLAERSHLADRSVSFATHVDDVANLLRWEQLDDVVLCGHSYAGLVISAVADLHPERIDALVYLDAVVPRPGKSLLECNENEAVVGAILRSAAAVGGRLVPPLPAEAFGANAEDTALLNRLCTPHPLQTFCEPVTLSGAWLEGPRKTYARATAWQGYEQLGFTSFREIAGDPGWTKVDVAAGHDLMLDAPDALAEILIGA